MNETPSKSGIPASFAAGLVHLQNAIVELYRAVGDLNEAVPPGFEI